MLTKQKFERLARIRGLTPIARVPTRHGAVLIAEGWVGRDDEMIDETGNHVPHIQAMWAIERAGIDICQVLYCNRFSSQRARIEACMKSAWDWIGINMETGRYG